MSYKYLLKQLKLFVEASFIEFWRKRQDTSPLKTPLIWAIFTTQLILRLKTSVMKRAWTNEIEITVWED